MVNILKRTTVMVRDIPTSVRWYERVLGLGVYYDDEVVLSGHTFAGGAAGERTRLVILQAADPEIGMLGLLQWLDPPRPAPAEIPTEVRFGAPAFVVRSDDARAAWRAAIELGTRVHAEPHEWSIRGANGRRKHFLTTCLFDPDGYFFEINQLERESDD